MNRGGLTSAFCFSCFASLALAQPPVAPSPTPAGPPQGEHSGNFNVADSFELGYRFHTVGGSVNQYRSTVTYGDGIRLLNSSMLVVSKDGRGRLFEQISLTTLGLALPLRFVLAPERLLQPGPGLGRRRQFSFDRHHLRHAGPQLHAVSAIQVPVLPRVYRQHATGAGVYHGAGTPGDSVARRAPPLERVSRWQRVPNRGR